MPVTSVRWPMFGLARRSSLCSARLLAAVNLEHARLESPVRDGDEVGFFPPVTGG